MLLQKTKLTTRKFYGKWLYKASFEIQGCAFLRSKSIEETEQFCFGNDPSTYQHSTKQRAWDNRYILLDVCAVLGKHSKDQYNLRIESSILDVYTNDKVLYEEISNKLLDYLRHRNEPNESNIDILNTDQHYITVDKLPKGRYNYRVYLLPHKMNGDREAKQKYVDWLKRNDPKITCTPAIENWFIKTDWNWDRRYVLVEDEQTLLMLKLRNAEVVGRIYNFIVSDK